MSEGVDHAARAREALGFSRWWLVLAAAAMMAVVGPYQYVWSSLREPVATNLGIDSAALSTVFTLYVVIQAGSQFPVGWWRDRHGPRALGILAAVLAGGGYLALSVAETVWGIYLAYSLGAFGVGIVYTVAVNTALKWFPDRRGLTAGVGTMAFAGGSAALVPYVRANAGPGSPVTAYVDVLQHVGVLIFAVVFVGALVLRDPPAAWRSGDEGSDVNHTGRQFSWREMLRTRQFWLMYAMFVAVASAELMLIEKVVSYAGTLGLAATIATAAATLLPVASAVGRLTVGGISDRVGRTATMTGTFALAGIGLFAVVGFGRSGIGAAFVGAVVFSVFFSSPQYTLFPSAVADFYGEKHSSANYALLYSAKIWGGVFGGTVTGAAVVTLGWNQTFLLGGGLALFAAAGALVLDPPTVSRADDA
ncbi:MFS family permease [Halorhabdus sp. SVX81]|uniref:OFA family MFS transporter n=1 Tax=Halorhabdus sp. SVX81 TaxID=2978283 RepID=UPI0023DC5C53|nr:OFA family MFS transporter [Halorhabdus sp. SVX81]WEL18681.1 MFS family permease [Halorhabdus sp. SVX81]